MRERVVDEDPFIANMVYEGGPVVPERKPTVKGLGHAGVAEQVQATYPEILESADGSEDQSR